MYFKKFHLLFTIVLCCLVNLNFGNEDLWKQNFNMDFKINVAAWSLECYYLYLKQGDILHVIVNVISGGDKLVDIIIEDPSGFRIKSLQDKGYEWYDSPPLNLTGHYKVCCNNPEMSNKLVYFNLVSISREETIRRMHFHQQLNETTTYMEERFVNIAMNLLQVTRHQISLRIDGTGDTYYQEQVNDYVMYYSIVQSCLIVLCGLFQVYFIKKLFERPSKGTYTQLKS